MCEDWLSETRPGRKARISSAHMGKRNNNRNMVRHKPPIRPVLLLTHVASRDVQNHSGKSHVPVVKKPAPSTNPGPVPIKRVPSLRGSHTLSLHAGGGFTKAPSPRALPRPPMRWTAPLLQEAAAGVAGTPSATPPPQTVLSPPSLALQNSDSVVKQLQGNLLYALIAPVQPELAGKITGMLLELSVEEIAQLLADSAARQKLVDEALEVLQEAGDPRVAAPAPAGLSVDVAAASWTAGTGPMSCTTTVRVSPRVSSNPFSTNNILMLQ